MATAKRLRLSKLQISTILTLNFILIFSSATIMLSSSRQQQISHLVQITQAKLEPILLATRCSKDGPIRELERSNETSIRRLSVYQQVCNSRAIDYQVYYTEIPRNSATAKTQARVIANTLNESRRYNIKPIILVKPSSDWKLIKLSDLSSGAFDENLNSLFRELSAIGLTSKTVGTWIPIPMTGGLLERNIPTQQYGQGVNKFITILRQNFPEAKTGILLGANQNQVTGTQLIKYAQEIDTSMIDTLAIESLPKTTLSDLDQWNSDSVIHQQLIIDLAESTNVKNLIITTGSYTKIGSLNPEKANVITATQRKELLDDIRKTVIALNDRGYKITLNILTENQGNGPGQVDWSYWSNEKFYQSEYRKVFIDFIAKLHQHNIMISLDDKINLMP